MNEHQPRAVRPARLLGTFAAVVAAITIAACGSSAPNRSTAASPTSSPTGANASTGSGSSSASSTLAFSNCMRSHGVPNFPDLGSNGIKIEASGQTLSVNGVSVDAPAFLAARQECQKYMPTQQATPTEAAHQRQRGLEFAKCMRSHGVPNFPDPKVVSSHGGNQVLYLPGINPQSPAFEAAAKACGGGPKGP
jgi:hypothetical protein